MPPRKLDPKPCACGCGKITKTGKFLPGHDQKLRSAIEREVGGLENLKDIVEAHLGHPVEAISRITSRHRKLITPELQKRIVRALRELSYQFEEKSKYLHGSRMYGDSVFISHSGLLVRATKHSSAANLLRAYLGQPNGVASEHGGENERLDTWVADMDYTEALKAKLHRLAEEVNSTTGCHITFHQQKVNKENMSFSGGNGRIWIPPFHDQYDICLSGQSLEKQMYGFMRNLCGKEHDGYKQTKPEPHSPFWRVSDFELVRQAVYHYAETREYADKDRRKSMRFRSGEGSTTKIGYVNDNGQMCRGHRGKSGNDHEQYAYKMYCKHCRIEYGANGSDIHLRKCPNCQGGAPGIEF